MSDFRRQFSGTPPPTGINPFAQPPPPVNPYGYDLETSYEPYSEDTVPSVQPHENGSLTIPVSHSAVDACAVPPVPAAAASHDPFINSTTLHSASGKIGSATDEGKIGGSIQQQQQLHQQQNPSQPHAQQVSDSRPLLQQVKEPEDPSKYPFYNIRRYRPYFDVDSNEVLWRVGNSLIGAFRANFMQVTQERPDLYGPFWICTTLIFVTAVAGNFASYLEWRQNEDMTKRSPPPPGTSDSTDVVDDQWFADFTKLSASAAIFYGYTYVVGFVVWLVLHYFRSDMRLVNMLCIYGYSLSIYIPISLVCVLPIDAMRWSVVLAGTATSGFFLFMNLQERIKAAGPGRWLPLLLIVLGVHFGIGIVLKLFFFSY